jgi:hypothetical protein
MLPDQACAVIQEMSIWDKVSFEACTRFQEMGVLDNFSFQICTII